MIAEESVSKNSEVSSSSSQEFNNILDKLEEEEKSSEVFIGRDKEVNELLHPMPTIHSQYEEEKEVPLLPTSEQEANDFK